MGASLLFFSRISSLNPNNSPLGYVVFIDEKTEPQTHAGQGRAAEARQRGVKAAHSGSRAALRHRTPPGTSSLRGPDWGWLHRGACLGLQSLLCFQVLRSLKTPGVCRSVVSGCISGGATSSAPRPLWLHFRFQTKGLLPHRLLSLIASLRASVSSPCKMGRESPQ